MSGTTGNDSKFPITRFKERVEAFNETSSAVYELGYYVGVVCCSPLDKVDHEELIELADKAMYMNKGSCY